MTIAREARRNSVLALLRNASGPLTVEEIAARVAVSNRTVHSDLAELRRRGHVIEGRTAMRVAGIAASRTAGVAVIDDTAGIPPKDPAAASLVDAALLLLADGGWKTNDTGGRYLATLGGRTLAERPDLHQLYAGMCLLNPPLDLGPLLSATGPALADPARVSVPTLFMAGAEDEVLPASVVREASSRVLHARFELFEGAGHSPHFQHAERFNQLLAEFLGSVSQVGRRRL